VALVGAADVALVGAGVDVELDELDELELDELELDELDELELDELELDELEVADCVGPD
jgi:hypothetical protein